MKNGRIEYIHSGKGIVPFALRLIVKLLRYSPTARPTSAQLLKDVFFTKTLDLNFNNQHVPIPPPNYLVPDDLFVNYRSNQDINLRQNMDYLGRPFIGRPMNFDSFRKFITKCITALDVSAKLGVIF